jgi:transcriptional regulator with XRE-family HTH domain
MNKEEIFFNNISKRLVELRKKAGYSSQEAFADVIGISKGQYSRYERGGNFTMETFYKILKFYKLTAEEFFGEGFE